MQAATSKGEEVRVKLTYKCVAVKRQRRKGCGGRGGGRRGWLENLVVYVSDRRVKGGATYE